MVEIGEKFVKVGILDVYEGVKKLVSGEVIWVYYGCFLFE